MLPKLRDTAQPTDETAPPAPLGGTRSEAVRRLQIGLSGLAAMILMVALASVVLDRARQTDATTVPEAAATTEPVQTAPAPKGDPLAEAGVVPDLPAEPSPKPTQSPAVMPEQGKSLENQGE